MSYMFIKFYFIKIKSYKYIKKTIFNIELIHDDASKYE